MLAFDVSSITFIIPPAQRSFSETLNVRQRGLVPANKQMPAFHIFKYNLQWINEQIEEAVSQQTRYSF